MILKIMILICLKWWLSRTILLLHNHLVIKLDTLNKNSKIELELKMNHLYILKRLLTTTNTKTLVTDSELYIFRCFQVLQLTRSHLFINVRCIDLSMYTMYYSLAYTTYIKEVKYYNDTMIYSLSLSCLANKFFSFIRYHWIRH